MASANLNVMIKAARKAGRSLVKDFREVENLQVSVKGAGDFVSRADREAERIIKEIRAAGKLDGAKDEEDVELEVLVAQSIRDESTYDGIDWGGEKIASEVRILRIFSG